MCVRHDRTPFPEDDPIYRAEIYHSGGNGLVFSYTDEEAVDLFFRVDHRYRSVPGDLESIAQELERDADKLRAIYMLLELPDGYE